MILKTIIKCLQIVNLMITAEIKAEEKRELKKKFDEIKIKEETNEQFE